MSNDSQFPDKFPIEFHTVLDNKDEEYALYLEAETTLHDLMRGHSDLSGAALDITKPAQNRETSYIYEAGVVVYASPHDIVATEQASTPAQALKQALDAIERQVREQRDKLRNY